jgi:hypothetical protein
MHDVPEVIDWYKTHEVYPGQLTFDPDGMCLAITRTARDIGPRYPSALSAQLNTPVKYRVTKIEDIRMGMVGFSDDPNDSNPFGHVYTFVGRLRGVDPSTLDSLLVRTNSVISNQIVVVKATYFKEHWGDDFQFAATWLNGEELIGPWQGKQSEPKPEPKPEKVRTFPRLESAIDNMAEGINDLQKAIKAHKKDRYVTALTRDLEVLTRAHDRLEKRLENLKNR